VKTKQINFATTRAIQNIKVDTGVRIKDLAKYKNHIHSGVNGVHVRSIKDNTKARLRLGRKGKDKRESKATAEIKHDVKASTIAKSIT